MSVLKIIDQFAEEVNRSLEHLRSHYETHPPEEKYTEVFQEDLLSMAEQMLARARILLGIACKKCSGMGHRTYGSTATWRRNTAGGAALTDDVCDECWGTGVTTRTGPNLREISQRLKKSTGDHK